MWESLMSLLLRESLVKVMALNPRSSRNGSARTPYEGGGNFHGKVTLVYPNGSLRVFVNGLGINIGPCRAVLGYEGAIALDDEVLVGYLDNQKSEMVVFGRLTAHANEEVRNLFSSGSVLITPTYTSENGATMTSGNISWGRTLSTTPKVTTSANSSSAAVTHTAFTNPTTTGVTVWVLRNSTTATTVHAIGVVP